MTQVIIPPALGGDGLPFSDDGTSARDMQGQGYAGHFFPMVAQAVAAVQVGVQAAGAIATGSTNTASTTSLVIGTGSKSLAVEADKALVPGMWVLLAYRADPAKNMTGQVTSYDAGTGALVLNVTATSGAGTYADWAGSVTGAPAAVPGIARTTKTGAYTLVAADKGALVECSGTWTLGLDAAATLGNGWWCYVRNKGAGDITLEPDGAETIDGLANFVLYPGAVRLVLCDGTALYSIPIVGGAKTFTTTGSYVWAPGVQQWDADLIAGGAGGGGGARAATRYNGGGGGAGERLKTSIALSEVTVGASVTCTVGAKGIGGAAAASDNTSGSPGTNGGNSSIGTLVIAVGSVGGNQGSTGGHGAGGMGGGSRNTSELPAGLTALGGNATGFISGGAPAATEWGGPLGGNGASNGATARLGKQKSGSGGGSLAAGGAGANGVNPGDGGDGGAGRVNGSPAGKGGDGADGKITIVEVI